MIRRFFVWLHRWFGLAMALFLIIEGLTGSLLAFNTELTRLFNPQLFVAQHEPSAKPLDLAALAARVEAIAPQAQVAYFAKLREDQAVLRCHGHVDPATGKRFDIGFKYLVLDPYTGNELGRLTEGFYSRGFLPNVMPFVYDLHLSLALGETGAWILSVLVIVWTIDCFIGFYLTLPIKFGDLWRRWKPAWLVKWRASAYRVNFDLHRASGLWLWPMLFAFAWSSVNLAEKTGVYHWVTGTLFDYQSPMEQITFLPMHPVEHPKLDWSAAQTVGEKLVSEQASSQGFKIEKPISLNYFVGSGLYNYRVRTNRSFPDDKIVTLFFDGDTGAFYRNLGTREEHFGNTVTNWLRALHMISDPVDYLPYRIFVVAIGIVIAMLSITGVYIWWKKRKARAHFNLRRKADFTREGTQSPELPQGSLSLGSPVVLPSRLAHGEGSQT